MGLLSSILIRKTPSESPLACKALNSQNLEIGTKVLEKEIGKTLP
jgi:hypothetical protein